MFLLGHAANFTDADIETYAKLDVYGLGIDKDLLVIKDENGHIDYTNKHAVDKVRRKNKSKKYEY